MFDDEDAGAPGESAQDPGGVEYRDVVTGVRDRKPGSASAADADPLPCLIADAEPAVLGRTVLALAAMHEPDENGRCRVCSTRWRWRRSRREAWCSTRRMLWATLVEGHPAGAS